MSSYPQSSHISASRLLEEDVQEGLFPLCHSEKVSLSLSHCWNKTPDILNLKAERFSLAQGFSLQTPGFKTGTRWQMSLAELTPCNQVAGREGRTRMGTSGSTSV